MVVVAGTAGADSALNALIASRGHDGAGAGDRRGQGRAGRRKGAETEGADGPRARSRREGARDPRTPTSTRSTPATPPTGNDRTGRHRTRRVGAADDQRRCDEYLSRRVLPQAQPDLRIVSRITHERNVEAIHRAGADFVLSYTTLGVDSIMSLVNGAATVTVG